MTQHHRMLDNAVTMVNRCRMIMRDADPATAAECAGLLDQAARQIDTTADSCRDSLVICVQAAAWCRLGAGLLRGEDVPESIHAPEGESPSDAARWRRWRV